MLQMLSKIVISAYRRMEENKKNQIKQKNIQMQHGILCIPNS